MIRRQKLIGIVASVLLAAVGTGLLVAYVRSAEDRALKGEKTVDVLVVSNTIPKGTKAEDITSSLRMEQVPVKIATREALTSTSPLAGKVAAVDLLPGEQLVSTRFTSPAEAQGIAAGLLQVTIALEPVRALGGQLRKGDSVGVTVSFDEPETTHLILHKVRVTDVRTTDGATVTTPANGPAPAAGLLVTLAVDAPSMEKVVFGAEHGRLWLAWEPKEANESGTKVQTKAGVNL
ncbi:MAG TPA: Flp pilus assembly protein CpaB [Acidimicrobiales bacterium]|jgi:pilus assembly protein CpaB|nr:Flp pilus assembly protein CpaB [Acidimicrobiales bacterium]